MQVIQNKPVRSIKSVLIIQEAIQVLLFISHISCMSISYRHALVGTGLHTIMPRSTSNNYLSFRIQLNKASFTKHLLFKKKNQIVNKVNIMHFKCFSRKQLQAHPAFYCAKAQLGKSLKSPSEHTRSGIYYFNEEPGERIHVLSKKN